jgi:hypothetical protein
MDMRKPCAMCAIAERLPKYSYCRECRNAKAKVFWANRSDSRKEKERLYREIHRQRKMKASAKWRSENKKRNIANIRAWGVANPDKLREYSRTKYLRNKKDPMWRLRRIVSAGVWRGLRDGKNGHWCDLLGYDANDLREHLERQFVKGMSWDNMGEWHLDHIVPLSGFTYSTSSDPEFKRAWSLSNLRPIWREANLKKGAKRLFLL